MLVCRLLAAARRRSCAAPMPMVPRARVCALTSTSLEPDISMNTSPLAALASMRLALTLSIALAAPTPVSALISSKPRSILTVTAVVDGMVRLRADRLRVSRLRFRLAKPGASRSTKSTPETARLPFSPTASGAFSDRALTPLQRIASFWPANRP